MYEVPRIIIEVASAIIYFILVKYMIKPYSLTREQRYLGLPLGFAFLGISEIIFSSTNHSATKSITRSFRYYKNICVCFPSDNILFLKETCKKQSNNMDYNT